MKRGQIARLVFGQPSASTFKARIVTIWYGVHMNVHRPSLCMRDRGGSKVVFVLRCVSGRERILLFADPVLLIDGSKFALISYVLTSVHPMSCQVDDIGCTENEHNF